jgi:hypothetical protein
MATLSVSNTSFTDTGIRDSNTNTVTFLAELPVLRTSKNESTSRAQLKFYKHKIWQDLQIQFFFGFPFKLCF